MVRHTVEVSGFTMDMDLESRTGGELDDKSVAEVEFVEGVKVYAGMLVQKYGVTEEDVYGWLINLGDQAKDLLEKKEQ